MKKFLVLLFAVMICFSLTACGNNKSSKDGNTLTCTKEEKNDEGYNTKEEYVLSYNDKDIITKIENTSISEMDKESIELTIGLSSLATSMFDGIDGISMKVTKEGDNAVKTVTIVDFNKLDTDKLKDLISEDGEESSLFDGKDMTINEFKKENLEGFSCK